jgi:hypothetical protein
MKHMYQRLGIIATLLLAQAVWLAPPVSADQLTNRTLALGTTTPSAVTSYDISFTTATTANIGSIRFQFCTDRFGTCVVPVGMDTMSNGVVLTNQFGMTAFTYQQVSQGEIVLVRSASPELAGVQARYTFSGITNPSFSNVSFYVRIATYASNDGSGPEVDSGGAVASINSSLLIQGITPETLSFCVGVSGSSCSDLNGQLIGFGDFQTTLTSSASTVMFAATNAPGGYTINMYGSPLASGTNIIPPMGAQSLNSTGNDPSTVGTSQFGTNVVDNSVPNVGADVSGGGIANPSGGYGTANRFRFFSGDTIATAAQPTNINKFTNSYVVNISPTQPIGFYTTTLSYICTGNF